MTVMPTVRLEDDVLQGLKSLAEPFVDTPSSVIRRLLEEKGILTAKTAVIPAKTQSAGTGSHVAPAANSLTPQALFEQYLLAILDQEFKSRGHKRNVTQAVIEKMRANGLIGPLDLELVATGETKAENTIAWARNALKERGYISRLSPRGIWELTPDGRAAAKEVKLHKA
jgi:predicted transcriptional regulator